MVQRDGKMLIDKVTTVGEVREETTEGAAWASTHITTYMTLIKQHSAPGPRNMLMSESESESETVLLPGMFTQTRNFFWWKVQHLDVMSNNNQHDRKTTSNVKVFGCVLQVVCFS